MATLAQTALHVLHSNKEDSSANVSQDGKDSYVKLTQTTVLRNLVFLALPAQI